MKLNTTIQQFVFLCIIMLMSVSTIEAQVEDEDLDMHKIKVTARSFGDSIILRWAPIDFKSWQLGNENGYRVERYLYTKNGVNLSQKERIASKKEWAEPIKLASPEEWEVLMEKDEKMGIAAMTIFGEDFAVADVMKTEGVSVYHKSREQESRFGFGLFAADQSLEVAKAMGLTLVDNDVRSDEEYIYSVHFFSNPENKDVLHGAIKIATSDRVVLPTPEILDFSFGDRTIQFSFKRLVKSYSTYDVERSSDGGQTFERVNEHPIIFTPNKGSKTDYVLFMDSIPQNNVSYQFRVLGNSIYDEVSPPSKVIEGMGVPTPLKARPVIADIAEVNEGQMQIQWGFVDSLNSEIVGFNIFRASKKGEEFIQINKKMLLPTDRLYLDESALPTNYYLIKGIDNNGNELRSLEKLAQLLDHTAPLQPIGLNGTLDEEEGMVSLSWKPNLEDDLKGYRVFLSNHGKGDFSQVTSQWLTDTSFTYQVTMNTLAEEIYFKIIAIDFHDNFSDFSEVCIVKRPDTRAPNAPAFTAIKASVDGVKLSWASSSSEDVIEHRLQRKVKNTENWEVLSTYTDKQPLANFIDTTASKRLVYQYRIIAKDDADLETSSKILEATPTDNFVREGIQNVSANSIRQTRAIQLSWNYENVESVSEFVIYRAIKDKSVSTYKVIDSTKVQIAGPSQVGLEGKIYFDDRNVERGQEYIYQIIAKHKDGGFSPLTLPVVMYFN